MKNHNQEELLLLTTHAKSMKRILTYTKWSHCAEGKRIHIRLELTRVVVYLYKYGVNLTWLLD